MPAANLRPLAFDDIQLLRYWRNLDHVRQRMVFQEIIGRDQQREWFNELNNGKVNYFIYSLDDKDIGSVHLTTLDSHEKTFEAGIFCGDQNFLRHCAFHFHEILQHLVVAFAREANLTNV